MRLLRQQGDTFKEQVQTLRGVDERLAANSSLLSGIASNVRESLMVLAEMQRMVTQISQIVLNAQFSASISTFLRFIDPTTELPVTAEDSLIYTIPSE